MKKKMLSLALAVCLALAVPAGAADAAVYLDGYSNGDPASAGTKECSAGQAQLSMTGQVSRTGAVKLGNFSDSMPVYTCPIYTASGPVTLTVMDAPEDGLSVTAAQVHAMSYDAGTKFYSMTQEDAAFFDGTISFPKPGSEEREEMTLQAFYSDPAVWNRVGGPTAVSNGASVTLSQPGIYEAVVYLEAQEGGCIVLLIIPEPSPAVGGFSDVTERDFFAGPVLWAVERKVTAGTGDGSTFSPEKTCSVGEILTFLWRAKGSPAPQGSTSFRDVNPGDFYAQAAQWALEQNLIEAEGFDPSAPCTRAMVVTYLWKLAGSPDSNGSIFTDVSFGDPYVTAVGWAVANKITSGTGDGLTFSPDKTCTRGEIVTFLYRALA